MLHASFWPKRPEGRPGKAYRKDASDGNEHTTERFDVEARGCYGRKVFIVSTPMRCHVLLLQQLYAFSVSMWAVAMDEARREECMTIRGCY